MKIVFLTSGSNSSVILYNQLKKRVAFTAVIQENPIDKFYLIKRRGKKLGWFKTIGQLLFMIIVPPVLNRLSNKRKKEILKKFQLENLPIHHNNFFKVDSVNSRETQNILVTLNPDLIIVNGTRIISETILNCTSGKFINTHVGITPKYRGVHGGYWALANGDSDLFGVTVHLVNKGIDTGDILYQKVLKVDEKDNFSTYPLLQTAAAVDLLFAAIDDQQNGELKPYKNKDLPSQLWYHPTLLEYLWTALIKGVR